MARSKQKQAQAGTEKLTVKQKRFAEEYIKTGNATQAAKDAGYSAKTARTIGQENLTKPAVKDYIAQRMAELEAKKVASADEVIQFFSAVMRGEVKDAFGLDASLTDRMNAGKELMKRHAVSESRNAGETPQIVIDL